MKNWLSQLLSLDSNNLDDQKDSCVVITVAETLGSSPREAGAKLIVTQENIFGTIGGGNLEFKAIELARQALDSDGFAEGVRRILHRFPLGPSLGQCCGGLVILHLEYFDFPMPEWIHETDQPCLLVSVINEATGAAGNDRLMVSEGEIAGDLIIQSMNEEIQKTAIEKAQIHLKGNDQKGAAWLMPVSGKNDNSKNRTLLFFESVPVNNFHIVLFGAGHVGKAIVSVMSDLPCQIIWVDNREEQFPDALPLNVQRTLVHSPLDVIATVPANSYFLVMTHSHELDLDLSERILQRDDFRYFGLIGSNSKRNRFEKRLRQRSVTKDQLQSMTCPIGISGIKDKQPGAIAISVAAELLRARELFAEQEKSNLTEQKIIRKGVSSA